MSRNHTAILQDFTMVNERRRLSPVNSLFFRTLRAYTDPKHPSNFSDGCRKANLENFQKSEVLFSEEVKSHLRYSVVKKQGSPTLAHSFPVDNQVNREYC